MRQLTACMISVALAQVHLTAALNAIRAVACRAGATPSGTRVRVARAECCGPGHTPMALLLGDMPGLEQVELDAPGDDRDGGLAWFAGGEVAGFLGLAGAGPVRAV